ncbi:hypothetical protein [Thermoflavimicrobium daqui]|jgi:hypothetical protein|uniref:hypothetical protein n=1 Tax=Thermoflavimicrobium daqui TaxID=2137476 RepID=UPI00143CCA05|nr:hypothetical protein [Thermoflavimicrobium daqui]
MIQTRESSTYLQGLYQHDWCRTGSYQPALNVSSIQGRSLLDIRTAGRTQAYHFNGE